MYIPGIIEPVVIKWAIAHFHAVTAHSALVHSNPVLTAAKTGSHLANTFPGAANAHAYVPVLNQGATATVLSQGTTGATGAAAGSAASASALRDALELAVPVITWAVCHQLRKSELFQEVKDALSAG